MTRFARPFGAARSLRAGLSNWLRQLSNPGQGFSSPQWGIYKEKSPYFRTSSFLNMAVRGGLTRFARPFGAARSLRAGLSNWLRQLSNPGRGFSSPQWGIYKEKSPYFRTSSFLNMAVRGGFEPPIRCRIHTFQACSFSHSDTSPYCRSSMTGTGANVGKYPFYVNQLF